MTYPTWCWYYHNYIRYPVPVKARKDSKHGHNLIDIRTLDKRTIHVLPAHLVPLTTEELVQYSFK